jgi:hypothetical protein
VCVLLVGVVALAMRGDTAGPAPGGGSAPTVSSTQPPLVDREAGALALLSTQAAALRTGTAATFADTWADLPVAQQRARELYSGVREVGARVRSMRYVGESATGAPAERQRGGLAAWTADVEVTWQPAPGSATTVRSTLSYTFAEHSGAVVSLDARPAQQGRAPVWSLGPLEVVESARATAVAPTPAAAATLHRELRTAVDDVRRVIPRWRGPLIAYLPRTATQLERLLGSAPGAHDGIAAVSTTVDGSTDPDAQAVIVLNPEVFGTLGETGRRVVLAHEATHVATEVVTVDLPLWVAEGFADYVGVGAVDVPLSVSARMALDQVAEHGPPARLPRDTDFAAGADDLEVAYELAWLANRLIARRHGEDALVSFYRSVVDRPSGVRRAFATLGSTQAEFTRSWRQHLAELADAG